MVLGPDTRVQSILKYVTEALKMKAENLKSLETTERMIVIDECEVSTVSLKQKQRSDCTVVLIFGHNCSYVLPPLTLFLFETLSNRQSLFCMFNSHFEVKALYTA